MGATTGSAVTGDYTWDTALVSWDDAIVGERTWDGASLYAYNLAVSDALGAVTTVGNGPAKQFASFVSVAEASGRRPTKRVFEQASMADMAGGAVGFNRKVSEAIAVLDKRTADAVAVRGEVISVADRRAAVMTKLAFESLSAVSQSRSWIDFARVFIESIRATDRSARGIGKRRVETLAVADSYADEVNFVRVVDEALVFAETYHDIINFQLGFSESVAISEASSKNGLKALNERVTAASRGARAVSTYKSSQFAVDDLFERRVAFYRNVREFIYSAEEAGKDAEKYATEAINIVGNKARKGTGKNIVRTLAFLELSGRALAYNRHVSEGFTTSDAIRRSVEVKSSEAIKIGEELLRGADGVIDELAVTNAAMTVEQFAKLLQQDSPSNYTEFRRLLPGDYEYQEALVRVSATSESGDRAVISDLSLQIDVPDVTDRGRVTCTSAGATYVTFARTFLEPPEVGLTVSGGDIGVVVIPRIIGAITKEGFTVGLFTTSGAAADGVVSWNATGY